MAEKAEALLAGSGWLPEPLRTSGRAITPASLASEQETISTIESIGAETAADGYETVMVETESSTEDEPVTAELHVTAAE